MLQKNGKPSAGARAQAAPDKRANEATDPQVRSDSELIGSRVGPIDTQSEPPFLFRCPVTGSPVRGILVVEAPCDDPNSFEPVSCLVCGRIHLLNFKTRKTVGEDRVDSGPTRGSASL